MIDFIKIHRVGSEMFKADGWRGGQTDRHVESNSPFSQFCEYA